MAEHPVLTWTGSVRLRAGPPTFRIAKAAKRSLTALTKVRILHPDPSKLLRASSLKTRTGRDERASAGGLSCLRKKRAANPVVGLPRSTETEIFIPGWPSGKGTPLLTARVKSSWVRILLLELLTPVRSGNKRVSYARKDGSTPFAGSSRPIRLLVRSPDFHSGQVGS